MKYLMIIHIKQFYLYIILHLLRIKYLLLFQYNLIISLNNSILFVCEIIVYYHLYFKVPLDLNNRHE